MGEYQTKYFKTLSIQGQNVHKVASVSFVVQGVRDMLTQNRGWGPPPKYLP